MKYFSKQRWLAALPEYQVSSMCMASTLHQWKIIWLKLISNFNSTVSNRDNIKRSTLWELIYQQMPKKVVTKLQKFGICSSLKPPPPPSFGCAKQFLKWRPNDHYVSYLWPSSCLSLFMFVILKSCIPFFSSGPPVLNIHVLVSFAWCQRKFERRCVYIQNRDRRFISGQTFLIFKTIMILVWFLVIFITNVSNSKGKTSLKKGKHELWFLKDIGWLDITFKYETFTWVFC